MRALIRDAIARSSTILPHHNVQELLQVSLPPASSSQVHDRFCDRSRGGGRCTDS
jgi:hypothetical protein